MSNKARPPIVVVMGHIDHGKSTLLDFIRNTNVVAGEVGGITQATSAYEAAGFIFLDTPGHAAFAGMRERGADIADLAILVVSAEEGVKTQTLEALDDILKAKLPYLVAINKIDRPNANPELIKQQLSEKGVLLEGYGGAIPAAEISAKTGAGVPELLELLKLLADLEELKADASLPASGFVLEAHLDQRVGISATLIIKDGTLNLGDFLVINGAVSKIKRLNNFAGEQVKSLLPASPAQVIGLAEVPPVGATFQTFTDKKMAEKTAGAEKLTEKTKTEIEKTDITVQTEKANILLEIPVVLKADVLGSLEALRSEVLKLNSAQVKLKILSESAGKISENDVKLAGAIAGSLVLGFSTSADKNAIELAEKLHVEIATFEIIYKLSEWLAEKIKSSLPKQEITTSLGRAKLLKIFGGEKDKQIVGGVVTEGKIASGKMVKVWRRDNEVARGKLTGLQESKIPTKEVEADHQFGALVEIRLPLAIGDVLEVIEISEQ